MKLLIYLILLIILFTYVTKCEKTPNEKFTNDNNDNKTNDNNDNKDDGSKFINQIQASNPYEVLINPQNFYESNQSITALNENPVELDEINRWFIKNSGYSDIFNQNDSIEITTLIDAPKPNNFLDITMSRIKPHIGSEPESNSNPEPRTNKYPISVNHNNLVLNLIGYIYNKYYNQYYLLYETRISQLNPNLIPNLIPNEYIENLDYQVFTYALVKIDKLVPVIKYVFGPRTKINIGDTVYLSQGPLQIGPMLVSGISNT